MRGCTLGEWCASLWLLLAAAAAAGAAAQPQQEASGNPEVAALLEIRSGFRNGQQVLPDWSATASSPCGWTGVNCSAGGQVVAL